MMYVHDEQTTLSRVVFVKQIHLIIRFKCIYLRKKNVKVDAGLDKYKTKLVVKGFIQQPNVDFVHLWQRLPQ